MITHPLYLSGIIKLAAYNRCISNFANALSKFLASLGTSDMPQPLFEIPSSASKVISIYNVRKEGIKA